MLKYTYLPRRRNINLSQLIEILVSNFLPDLHQKYLFENYKMNGLYRCYNDKIPTYLQGRPRVLIEHCLQMQERARKQLTEESILESDIENGKFIVLGKSDQKYCVDFGKANSKPSCSCHHWINTNFPCKHFFLIFQYKEKWNWDSLPNCYLNGPYLSADTSSLRHASENELVVDCIQQDGIAGCLQAKNENDLVVCDSDENIESRCGKELYGKELRPRVSTI